MNRAQTLGLLRHILTAVGAAMVARGTLNDAEMSEVIGALITLVGFGWSWAEKRRATGGPGQAVPSAARAAGLFVTAALLIGVLDLATGCGTTASNGDPSSGPKILTPQRVEAIARLASYLGARADLAAHPERRPAYVAAHAGLARLMAEEEWNPDAVAVVLSEAAIDQLGSDEGAIAITGGLMLTDALGLGTFDARRSDHAVALLTGLEDGLRRALAGPSLLRSVDAVDSDDGRLVWRGAAVPAASDESILRSAAMATRTRPTL